MNTQRTFVCGYSHLYGWECIRKVKNMTSSDYVFTIFYLMISVGLIYPPTEFVSAGFTIPSIFYYILGNEHESFVQYHLKKSCLNLLVYSLLPLGYIILSCLLGYIVEVCNTI